MKNCKSTITVGLMLVLALMLGTATANAQTPVPSASPAWKVVGTVDKELPAQDLDRCILRVKYRHNYSAQMYVVLNLSQNNAMVSYGSQTGMTPPPLSQRLEFPLNINEMQTIANTGGITIDIDQYLGSFVDPVTRPAYTHLVVNLGYRWPNSGTHWIFGYIDTPDGQGQSGGGGAVAGQKFTLEKFCQ